MAANLKQINKKAPLVSVVMSVYNCEDYVAEAIDSILNQTLTDFEFIIINDGSTDNTLKAIKKFKDPRIVLISRENKGLVASLKEGIATARGEYIARQDADDISVRVRLEEMIKLLRSQEDIGLVGSARQNIDEAGRLLEKVDPPHNDSDIRIYLYYHNPFCHGSIIFRRSVYQEVGGYEDNFVPAEDYRLWSKMLEVTKGVNLPDVLYLYRINSQGITAKKGNLVDSAHKRIESYILSKPDTILKGARPHRAILGKIFVQGVRTFNVRSATYPLRYLLCDYGLKRLIGRVIWVRR